MLQQYREHKKKNRNYVEETYDGEESDSEEIQPLTQFNRILPDKNDRYGIKVEVNGVYQNLTIDASSLVTIMPNNPTLYKPEDIKSLRKRYQDLNKNEKKFLGKVSADIKYNGETTKLPIFITQRNNFTPLLCVNWLKQLPNTINESTNPIVLLNASNNRSKAIHSCFIKLFEITHIIKHIEKNSIKTRMLRICNPT